MFKNSIKFRVDKFALSSLHPVLYSTQPCWRHQGTIGSIHGDDKEIQQRGEERSMRSGNSLTNKLCPIGLPDFVIRTQDGYNRD